MAQKTPSWEFSEICASKTLNCLLVRQQRKLKQQKVHQIVFCKLEPKEIQFRKHLPACLDLCNAGVSHSTRDWKVLFNYHDMIHDFFYSSWVCVLGYVAHRRISTSRQPKVFILWPGTLRRLSKFLWKPAAMPFTSAPASVQQTCLAHRMNFHQVRTEKHERSISSTVVSSLQWWSWITRRDVASLSVESGPASHSSLMTVEARWRFCVRCKYSFSSEAGNKNAPKNISRRLCGVDAEYTDGSNSTNVMPSESFLLPPMFITMWT